MPLRRARGRFARQAPANEPGSSSGQSEQVLYTGHSDGNATPSLSVPEDEQGEASAHGSSLSAWDADDWQWWYNGWDNRQHYEADDNEEAPIMPSDPDRRMVQVLPLVWRRSGFETYAGMQALSSTITSRRQMVWTLWRQTRRRSSMRRLPIDHSAWSGILLWLWTEG